MAYLHGYLHSPVRRNYTNKRGPPCGPDPAAESD